MIIVYLPQAPALCSCQAFLSLWRSCISAVFFSTDGMAMQDGDFQEERFRNIVNAYLANTLGNLVNRCLGLLKKNCDSTFPADAASLDASHPLRLAAAAEVGSSSRPDHGGMFKSSTSQGCEIGKLILPLEKGSCGSAALLLHSLMTAESLILLGPI